MANLISQANRLNDVEINNNKPNTSQLFRRIGSNINYILDFLSLTDGATSPTTGGFNQFSQVQTINMAGTISSATLNTPITVFTFQGAGDRKLFYYENNGNGYAPPQTSRGQAANILFDSVTGERSLENPISFLARKIISAGFVGSLAGGTTVASVRVDGVDFARVIRGAAEPAIFSEITLAPTGTHTVSVVLQQLNAGATPSLTFQIAFILALFN